MVSAILRFIIFYIEIIYKAYVEESACDYYRMINKENIYIRVVYLKSKGLDLDPFGG